MRNNVFDLDQDSTIVSVLALREPYPVDRSEAPSRVVKMVLGCAAGLAILYLGAVLPWS